MAGVHLRADTMPVRPNLRRRTFKRQAIEMLTAGFSPLRGPGNQGSCVGQSPNPSPLYHRPAARISLPGRQSIHPPAKN